MSKVKQLSMFNGTSWVPYDIDASYLGGIVATNYARINVSNFFTESQTFNKGMIVSGGISCQGTVDVIGNIAVDDGINLSGSDITNAATINCESISSGTGTFQGNVNINNDYSNGAFIYTVTDGVAPMHVIFKMIYTFIKRCFITMSCHLPIKNRKL